MNTKQCTEITDNGMPLRQGDILFFSMKGDSEKYGIVVTGDCDIVQKKCHGIISYCTVTTAKHYIASEILLDICNPEIDKLKVAVTKSVCNLLSAENSNTFLTTLLSQNSDYLRNLIKDERLMEKILLLKDICSKSEFSLSDYKKLFFANNNKELDNEKLEKAKNRILSKLNSLPGDKYYISELPNQNDSLGYIVHLRFINTILEEDIMQQRNLFRIGHLEAPYLYKLTQKLGAVFSDIGEPTEFENERKIINTFIMEEFIK